MNEMALPINATYLTNRGATLGATTMIVFIKYNINN